MKNAVNFFYNKKGISDIVVYLLIIVISMIAIGILWIIVANVLSQGSGQVSSGVGQLLVSLKIEKVQVESNGDVSVTVKRNAGAGDLAGVKFIFSDGNNAESFDNKISLKELDEKTFDFELQNINSLELKTISIAPIY